MTIHPDNFFRDVTMALCSSLDISTSMQNCFDYLRRYFPLDRMIFALYDHEACAIQRIASVSESGADNETREISLPAEVGRIMEGIHDSDRLIPDTMLDPLTAAVAPYVNNQGCSEILLPLRTREDQVGYLVLQAQGLDLYSREHLQLIGSVREPMAMAMANALSHQDVVLQNTRLAEDNRHLQKELSQLSDTEVVGENSGLSGVMEMVRQVAPLQNTVLIMGETGVGKEVIANAIHQLSPRSHGPFIKVNCGAIPESLVDSELFGHEKGSFSGAVAQKRGRFERANGGTIFLDEIGELPPAAQIRLLRVLQNREIERVGGGVTIPVDIRVIAATHRNLDKMVVEGFFREDLWFRINVFPIIIPPLRQRKEDIPLLLRSLVARKSRELGYRTPPPVAQGAMEKLMEYPWPGNVRELENVVERALIQNKGRALTLNAFALSQHHNGPLSTISDACGCVFPCLSRCTEKKTTPHAKRDKVLSLDEMVSSHIRDVLEQTDGKINGKDGAAELLGVNPSTLRNRMKKLGISYGRNSDN